MTLIVPRTCTNITERDNRRNVGNFSQPLELYRSEPGYVLLGDPGSGKTTAFKKESEHIEDGFYITARDFLKFFDPEWHNKTLFIDGLDEVRAGKPDARVPFDDISSRLYELGKPRFRLSCREADWLGNNDLENLKKVVPGDNVSLLRLDPLEDSDIKRVLESHPCIDDATRFILKARDIGIDGLLENPQSLNLMITAVASGGRWPRSLLETYELACRVLAKEQNEEHVFAADLLLFNPDHILDAAGRLCALMLISGGPGFRLRHHQGDTEALTPDQSEYERPEHLVAALSTKLFKADTEGRFVSVHRHMAEFLSARHLTSVVKNGLPVRRVIALVAGGDGMVVSELRGLSAWLAAHCAQARRELIVRDPTGVGQYGDIRGFSLNEKRELLEALKHHVLGLENIYQTAPAFSALATPDMEPALREILEDSNPAKEYQEYLDFVLCVLGYGDQLPGLSDVIFEIVCDSERMPWVNRSALIAFIHNCPESDMTGKIEFLLHEIEMGNVPDSENALLGKVLSQLYPSGLPPSRIWDYLRDSARHVSSGMFDQFWRYDFLDRSSDDQVAELLDSLVDRLPDLYIAIRSRQADDLVMELLSRGLVAHGDTISPDRLYDWLGIGSPDFEHQLRDMGINRSEIRAWLGQRPDTCQAIILEGLNRCSDSDDFWSHTLDVESRLYHTTMPADYGRWCLDQAVTTVDTKPRIAEYLWEQAIDAYRYQRNNEGLSLELLKRHARKNETFKERLDERLNTKPLRMVTPEGSGSVIEPDSTPDQQFDRRRKRLPERHRKAIEQRQQKERKWLDHVRSREVALRENRAEPALLYRMARVYFGPFFNHNGEDGPKAVKKNLQDDPDLADAVLVGLRGTVDREDMPNVDDILQHYEADKRYYIGLPCLAGLAERERTAFEDTTQWHDDRTQKALAFYFTEAHGDYQPEWLQRLLADRPQTVADLYIRYARSKFRRGQNGIQDIQQLSSNPDYAEVARRATIPLLKAFPTRSRSIQIETLEHLLTAAISYADRSSLESLVESKLSRTSMNVAQRARWLAAGLIVSPGKYYDSVASFVGTGRGRVSRIYDLMSLLHPDVFESLRFPGPSVSVLELLIRLVGRDFEPDAVFGIEEFDEDGESMGGMVTNVMSASFSVRAMIERLATDPSQDATDALEALLADDTLTDWHNMLGSRLHTQLRIRRDTSYHRLTIEQISQTLKGGTPANAGDLAALVVDRLSELATTIRDGNTDIWKQYWNEDSHGRPVEPKHEDSCRDTLLFALRHDLQQRLSSVDVQPEGQYANDKRSDMRIAFSNFQVPVEVKKNSHRELWSAMHRQLIRQYVRDPATDGYGIYLVFWFGEEYTQAAPSGKRPDTPQELQKRLTETLSPDEARKISVCVLDVSATESL